MMDIVERLAQQAAEAINGGEFYDGTWYTEGQRQAWRKAMTPAASEIERLQETLHRISLGSQNSGTTKEGLGAEARKALREKD
jgi:hypothetical protein